MPLQGQVAGPPLRARIAELEKALQVGKVQVVLLIIGQVMVGQVLVVLLMVGQVMVENVLAYISHLFILLEHIKNNLYSNI